MILITGATGTVGKELLKLLARPEAPVRVLLRDHGKASSVSFPGTAMIAGDLAVPDTLTAAFDGVDKAFLLTPPVENQLLLEANFVDAAARAGVKRIVKLSALGAALDSPARLLRNHAESERRIHESGLDYTFLRPNQYMQNFLGFRPTIIDKGEFYAPMGNGRIGLVDVRDVAAVAAEVLEEHGHDGKIYDVTGPEALTYGDVAERFTYALGKPVTYVDVPPEAVRDAMLRNNMDPWLVEALLELYAWWKFDGAAEIADTVPHVARRDAITFAQFAHEYAPQFGRKSRDPLAEMMDNVNLDNMTPGA